MLSSSIDNRTGATGAAARVRIMANNSNIEQGANFRQRYDAAKCIDTLLRSARHEWVLKSVTSSAQQLVRIFQ